MDDVERARLHWNELILQLRAERGLTDSQRAEWIHKLVEIANSSTAQRALEQLRIAEESTPSALAKKIAEATEPLTFLSETQPVGFRDGTFRFVQMWTFHIDEEVASDLLLATLLADPHYQFGMVTADEMELGPVHGPFYLSNITAEKFTVVDVVAGIEYFRVWADGDGPVPAEQIVGDLGLVESLIRDADTRYLLPDLGDDGRHELGWILSDWSEFVLIDRAKRELNLVVLTDD